MKVLQLTKKIKLGNLSNLGLNWEKSCLSPQKNKRSVRTASQQQVRQKVYQVLKHGVNASHILMMHLMVCILIESQINLASHHFLFIKLKTKFTIV